MTQTSDLVNGEFGERVVLNTQELDWIASPQPGVERRLLDRIGGEVARATSLVRYAPGSRFPAHVHGGGEEFLVTQGVFSDESGDFPAGSYVRNPPGSRHSPHTDGGCEIFVKLRQMMPDDQAHVVIDTASSQDWRDNGPGVRRLELFSAGDGSEHVVMDEFAAGSIQDKAVVEGGEELLVISGALRDEHGVYGPGTWIRNPPGFTRKLASDEGAKVWRKSGHLAKIVIA